MKQNFVYCLLMLFVFTSCNSGKEENDGRNTTDSISVSSSAADDCCKAWKNFPNRFDDKDFLQRFDVPLDVSIVDECIREYRDKLGAEPPDINQVKFTYSVAFDTRKLHDWMCAGPLEHSDQIKVEFGIYTQAAIDKSIELYPNDPARQIPAGHLNKITVFLSPYSSGNRTANPGTNTLLDPFNLGSLHP